MILSGSRLKSLRQLFILFDSLPPISATLAEAHHRVMRCHDYIVVTCTSYWIIVYVIVSQPRYCTPLHQTVQPARNHTVLCTVLYCLVLSCTVLYCTILCCTVRYFTLLHSHYCQLLHRAVCFLSCTALHCAYCTVPSALRHTLRHPTVGSQSPPCIASCPTSCCAALCRLHFKYVLMILLIARPSFKKLPRPWREKTLEGARSQQVWYPMVSKYTK